VSKYRLALVFPNGHIESLEYPTFETALEAYVLRREDQPHDTDLKLQVKSHDTWLTDRCHRISSFSHQF